MNRRSFLGSGIVALVQVTRQEWKPPFGIPHYHDGPPANPKALPALISGERLLHPPFVEEYQRVVYRMAATIPDALYQLPCFCYCDQSDGHSSLRSCYEGLHAAECRECMKEAVYAFQMLSKKKTISEIRADLERGEFIKIQLDAIYM